MRPELIAEIDKFSHQLESLSKWNSSEPFGHLDGAEDDYIYEFWCAMKLLSDLKTSYSIEVSSVDDRLLFPKKPAYLSAGKYTYFILTNKADTAECVQMFFGIKFINSYDDNDTSAPDIAFAKPIGRQDPSYNDALLILDAKFKAGKSRKLSKSLIKEFAKTVEDLGLRTGSIDLKLNKLADLNGNCLITNGEVIRKHENYCIRFKVRQIGNFKTGSEPIEVVGVVHLPMVPLDRSPNLDDLESKITSSAIDNPGLGD